MKITVKKERGWVKVTVQHDTAKKPLEIELNESQVQAVIAGLSMASKATAVEFSYELR